MAQMLPLRQAAAALDISRAKLLRLVRDGLEVTRQGERVYVDLEKAQGWIEVFGAPDARMAPTLHPDDPRFRHRFAATRLERLNLELAAGHVVPVDIAAERFAGELLALRGALFGLRHSFTETDLAAPDFPKKLATAIGEALVINLTIDDPKSWPAPGPLPTAPSAPDFTVRDETVYSPRYPDSDPRHAAASQKADATDAALTAFRAAHETLTKVLDLALFHCSEIRARLGEIPARLSPDADDIAETLSEEIIAALRDLSESPADVLRRRMREVRCEVLNPPARFG